MDISFAAASDNDDDGESVKLTFGETASRPVSTPSETIVSITDDEGVLPASSTAEGTSVTARWLNADDAGEDGASGETTPGFRHVTFNSGDTISFAAASDNVDVRREVKLTFGPPRGPSSPSGMTTPLRP